MSNTVQTLVFNRAGYSPVDIAPQWDYLAWRLNNVGVGKFSLPYEDENCTTDVLRPGNRVLVRFENGLPAFGGVIDLPRRRTATGVQVTLYSAEHILDWRRTAKSRSFASVTPGAIFQAFLEEANSITPTGIAVGSVYTGGTARTEEYHYHSLWDALVTLQRLSGEDFHIAPYYSGGRLTFIGNWYESRGVDLSALVLLAEDKNLAELVMDEQGPIANVVYAAGGGAGGTTWDDRLVGIAQDATSQNEYSYREGAEVITAVFDQTTLDASAAAILAEKKDARQNLSCVALDTDPAGFSSYNVGDTVLVQGFLKSSQWAIDQSVRVLGREWRPDNRCTLEVA